MWADAEAASGIQRGGEARKAGRKPLSTRHFHPRGFPSMVLPGGCSWVKPVGPDLPLGITAVITLQPHPHHCPPPPCLSAPCTVVPSGLHSPPFPAEVPATWAKGKVVPWHLFVLHDWEPQGQAPVSPRVPLGPGPGPAKPLSSA